MNLILIFLLLQGPNGDIESLVRDLGNELIELREGAHRRLLEVGEKALPLLRIAANSSDTELRTRAASIAVILERAAREKPHDQSEKAELLRLHRDEKAESRPGSGASEGARFDFATRKFSGGWIIHTSFVDYLARRRDEGEGRGRLRFDVASISDSKGRELESERCGRCSPRLILVRGGDDRIQVRLQGEQVWFSPYRLEFKDPAEGQYRRIGDYTIEVSGHSLTVSSSREFPYEWIPSMNAQCAIEWKPGLAGPTRTAGRRISCGGTKYRKIERPSWCDCLNGPQPVPPAQEAPRVSSFGVTAPVEVITYPGEADDSELQESLENFSRITYTFWKPILIPIDVKIEVPLK